METCPPKWGGIHNYGGVNTSKRNHLTRPKKVTWLAGGVHTNALGGLQLCSYFQPPLEWEGRCVGMHKKQAIRWERKWCWNEVVHFLCSLLGLFSMHCSSAIKTLASPMGLLCKVQLANFPLFTSKLYILCKAFHELRCLSCPYQKCGIHIYCSRIYQVWPPSQLFFLNLSWKLLICQWRANQRLW